MKCAGDEQAGEEELNLHWNKLVAVVQYTIINIDSTCGELKMVIYKLSTISNSKDKAQPDFDQLVSYFMQYDKHLKRVDIRSLKGKIL